MLEAGLKTAGIKTGKAPFFDTVRVEGVDAAALCSKAESEGMNLRMLNAQTLTISLDETTNPEDVDTLLKILGGICVHVCVRVCA